MRITSKNSKKRENQLYRVAHHHRSSSMGHTDGDVTLLEQMVAASRGKQRSSKGVKQLEMAASDIGMINHKEKKSSDGKEDEEDEDEEEDLFQDETSTVGGEEESGEETDIKKKAGGNMDEANAVLAYLETMVKYDDHYDHLPQEAAANPPVLTSFPTLSRKNSTDASLFLSYTSSRSGMNDIQQSDSDNTKLPEAFLRTIIQREFPSSFDPSLRDLINVGPHYRTSKYKPGEWVELRGSDMRWHCEMITRVLKIAPDDWDWNDPQNEGETPDWEYFYHAGDKRMLSAVEIRTPKEGLLRLFGQRPWIWQQWACLKLEHVMRFQEGHQNDFESKDVMKYVLDLWVMWLHHPDNQDFRKVYEDDRIGDRGRSELINHIMTPFDLIRRIQDDRDDWDFEAEASFSVFTYLGVLGSGYLVPLAIVILQILAPGLLIWNLLDNQHTAQQEGDCFELRLFGVGGTCPPGRVAQSMAVVILFYYFIKVIPSVFHAFFQSAGGGYSLYSRVLSIRRDIWIRGDDRWEQKIGFRLDEYMNTAYVNLLFILNMFIIINTTDAFEILLNALAFEFIVKFDEEFVDSPWWDPGRRWIMAGSMELVLQRALHGRILGNEALFADCYGLDLADLREAADQDPNLLRNRAVANRDVEDTRFMTSDEAVKFLCRRVAIETGNKEAIREYDKPVVFFGTIIKYLKMLWGNKGGGVFDRNGEYRTWSRWEKVMFLAKVPDLDDTLVADPTDSKKRPTINPALAEITSKHDKPFANLDRNKLVGITAWGTFFNFYRKVISLSLLCELLAAAWEERNYGLMVFRTVDGFFQWCTFALQLFFPVYTTICMVCVFLSLVGAI